MTLSGVQESTKLTYVYSVHVVLSSAVPSCCYQMTGMSQCL